MQHRDPARCPDATIPTPHCVSPCNLQGRDAGFQPKLLRDAATVDAACPKFPRRHGTTSLGGTPHSSDLEDARLIEGVLLH